MEAPEPARPGLPEFRAAAQAIAGAAIRTPLIASALPGMEALRLKLDCLQPTGAFKIRGALNAVARLAPGARGVVCCSTGNHGRALAWAAARAGLPAVICLSALAPEAKVRAVAALGARVIRVGASQDDAQVEADRLAEAEGLTPVPPFDHAHVIAGQGTLGLELIEDAPDLETILVPLSGGGLAAGAAAAAKALKPGVRVVGISMDRGAAMAASLAAGRPVEVTEVASLADSLGGGVGLENRLTFAMCRDLLDDVVRVTEAEIYAGMLALLEGERVVAEGASAVAHAAVLAGKIRLTGPTAALITGRNAAPEQIAAIAARTPVRLGDITVEAPA
ncbi:MAG: hydroxyectoine utilization dehydratase EutB [Rhodobacteraceae bacterium]|nr:hydroxyectoine utilization dehydratase EutB [Paracoccaceae bacterium]MBR28916.1 hydroxyectoine utilization dehydratase EutB [Paracoccaceae bacterium]